QKICILLSCHMHPRCSFVKKAKAEQGVAVRLLRISAKISRLIALKEKGSRSCLFPSPKGEILLAFSLFRFCFFSGTLVGFALCLCAVVFLLCNTGCLTGQATQIVKLRTANLTATYNFHTFHERGIDREYTLNAFAVRNLTN